jgi:hypothetical protein
MTMDLWQFLGRQVWSGGRFEWPGVSASPFTYPQSESRTHSVPGSVCEGLGTFRLDSVAAYAPGSVASTRAAPLPLPRQRDNDSLPAPEPNLTNSFLRPGKWTVDDERRLVDMRSRGATWVIIAQTVGRTEAAVARETLEAHATPTSY